MAFTDCTEQPIPIPMNKKKRRLYYSGKKKKHTSVKNLFTANQKGLIIYTKQNVDIER
ncbi:MAG: transposase family protein [Candidatus Nitrosocosmicus sp.]